MQHVCRSDGVTGHPWGGRVQKAKHGGHGVLHKVTIEVSLQQIADILQGGQILTEQRTDLLHLVYAPAIDSISVNVGNLSQRQGLTSRDF